MTKRLDLVGKKIGRLTVKRLSGIRGKTGAQYTVWECVCDCGKIKNLAGTKLSTKWTLSCGCIRSERIGNLNRSHESCITRIYCVFKNMHQRCYNKNNKSYKNYGGRNIRI